MSTGSRSETDRAIAEAFGHKPSKPDAASSTMSMREAAEAVRAHAFGRSGDAGQLAGAERAIAEGRRTEAPGSAEAIDSVLEEIRRLAGSRLGLPVDEARVYAQSEAMTARECATSVPDAVRRLQERVKALSAMPGINESPGRFKDLADQAIREAFKRDGSSPSRSSAPGRRP